MGDHTDAYITQGVIIFLITICFGLVIWKHLSKREYFPLKERSPVLTLGFLLATYFSIVILMVGAMLNVNNELGLQSPIFCVCDRSSNKDPSSDNDCNFNYQDNSQQQKDQINRNKYLLWVYLFTRYTQYITYFMRNFRIIIAFTLQYKWQWVIKVYSREEILIFIGLLTSLIITIASAVTNFNPFTFYIFISNEDNKGQQNLENYGKGSRIFFITFFILFQLSLLLQLLQSKRITRNYKLGNEILIILAFMVIFNNAFFIQGQIDGKDNEDDGGACNEIGDNILYLEILLAIIVDLVFMLIVVVKPFFLLGKGFILPPSIALNEFKNFIVDPNFFEIFYDYLADLEKNHQDGSLKMLGGKMLQFHMDLRKMKHPQEHEDDTTTESYMELASDQDQIQQEQYEEMINEYLIGEDNYDMRQQFHQEVLKNILIINENERIQIKQNLKIQNFEPIYIILQEKLSELFKEYKKTNSFFYIKKQIRTHEEINDRLYTMKLVSIDS